MRRFLLALLLITALVWAATACTFFTKTANGITLAGNSEDYFEADTCAVFLPPEKGKYGRVYFGWTHLWLQGGVNDQGLAYDIMSLSPKEYIEPPEGRKYIPGQLGLLCKIMEECATVEEALKLVNTHVNSLSGGANLMLADKTGDSAIVEGYTVYRRKGPYQICTNFRWAEAQHSNWRDNRYKAAEALLKECPVTVDAFRTVLTAVHAPLKNNTQGTLYSNVYDLVNNRIHLYLLHDFDRAHIIDMKQEFAGGPHVVRFSDYFPGNLREAQLRRRYEIRKCTAFDSAAHKLGMGAATVADGGPVLHLALDGNGQDSGPHALHGQGMEPEACPDRYGKSGAAMVFAAGGGIEIPHHPDLHLSSRSFTVALWLRVAAGEEPRNQVILNKVAPDNLDYWLMLASGRLQLHCKGKNAVLLVPGALTSDRWYHVAFRQDLNAGRLAVFMDGRQLLSTMLHATPATNNSPLRLGHSEIQHYASFTGAMDELRIYSRALSDIEIQDLAGE